MYSAVFLQVLYRLDLPHYCVRECKRNSVDSHEKMPEQPIRRNRNLSYIFMEEGIMTGIMDFELPEYSLRLFDPCYAAAMKAELKQSERKFASGAALFFILHGNFSGRKPDVPSIMPYCRMQT